MQVLALMLRIDQNANSHFNNLLRILFAFSAMISSKESTLALEDCLKIWDTLSRYFSLLVGRVDD